jgi:hypothetical protein
MAEQNFYRWYILAASFLILVIDGGVRFSFGVLIKTLVSESYIGVRHLPDSSCLVRRVSDPGGSKVRRGATQDVEPQEE